MPGAGHKKNQGAGQPANALHLRLVQLRAESLPEAQRALGEAAVRTYLLRDLPLRELLALRWTLELEMLRRFWWIVAAFMILALVVIALQDWMRRR
jgi:hypothetical protein